MEVVVREMEVVREEKEAEKVAAKEEEKEEGEVKEEEKGLSKYF